MAGMRALSPIRRVLVVDDNEQSREGYGYPLEEMGLIPVFQNKRIPVNLKSFVAAIPSRADAVFSDFRLTIQPNYARLDGDALVAACYQRGIPAILCSTFADVESHLNRMLLRYIPSLLRQNDPGPAVVEKAFTDCLREIKGQFRPGRRPWRTLVRINDVDDTATECHVIIPAHSVSEKIGIHVADLPRHIQPLIRPEARFHAEVNVGAESSGEIYFDKWEAS